MRDIGLVVRKIRKECGLTQAALSEKTKISRAHIASIESGAYSPTVKTLQRIADACGKQIKDFL